MEGITVEANRPEEGERGLGASHRRGGMGVASYRRPPEGLVKALDRVESPTSKAPGAKLKVESMRDKGAKRAASGKLHIDDGCMGGGEAVKHTRTLSENEFKKDLYNKVYNGNEGFTQNRKDIFHYCICADEIWTGRTGRCSGDKFVLAMSVCDNWPDDNIGSHFMHELGHSIGLHKSDFAGIDNDNSGDFWESDYSKYANYKSCMNYRYQGNLVDYSDGTHGNNDYDDWGNLDLGENL